MHGVTRSLFSGSSIIKVLFLIILFISFKVALNQDFLKSDGNIVTSENLLGYGIKCDTYYPDSPKVGNALFSLFNVSLNNLF